MHHHWALLSQQRSSAVFDEVWFRQSILDKQSLTGGVCCTIEWEKMRKEGRKYSLELCYFQWCLLFNFDISLLHHLCYRHEWYFKLLSCYTFLTRSDMNNIKLLESKYKITVKKESGLFSVLNEVNFDRNSCNSKRYSHADFATGLSQSRLLPEVCFARISPV